MLERPRIGLLSFAHDHANHWARALRRAPDADLVAIWDDDAARGSEAANRFGVDFEPDLATLLARTDVDAVGICSENNRHAEIAVAALAAGKHVLCEKPMATTLADCDAMLQARDRAGRTYMQAFPQRHDPSNLKLKALLAGGEIGQVLNARKRHGHGGLPLGWFEQPSMAWFLDPRRAGGGALLDEGIHAADVLRWLLGEPRRVWATFQYTTPGLAVEDNGHAIFEFEGGVQAVLQSSWTWLAGGWTTEVYGTDGTVLQQGNDCASTEVIGETIPRLQMYSRRKAIPGWYLDTDGALYFKEAHEEVARQFVRCLRAGDPAPVTGEDGRAALAMILAAYESARLGRPVELGKAKTQLGSGSEARRKEAG